MDSHTQKALRKRIKEQTHGKPKMDKTQNDVWDEELVADTCALLDTTTTTVTSNYDNQILPKESILSTFTQTFIPFLLAGFGMVAASLLLDKVQHWKVYQEVSEVYILVPALLGLKGNLEMTLASRLSTHANLGHLDTRKQALNLITGNLALILCQAIVVGFLASVAAVIFGWVPSGVVNINHALMLSASSILTAFGASFILGIVMIGVILISRTLNINPDNVATPIAASLGDLTTLACLSWLASLFYQHETFWLKIIIITFGLSLVPFWAWIASRNEHTREVLTDGWTPVIAAMLVSSVGGLILDFTVAQYKGVAVFQLVINGVGGNLVAVQASRISTELHRNGLPGDLPPNARLRICAGPLSVREVFLGGVGRDAVRTHADTARMLLLMVVPGHLIFAYTISYLQAGHTSFTIMFMLVYLTVALLQVVLLLYIAQVLTLCMWANGIDPDNSAIPYLTALGDLLGTFLLGVAFQFMFLIGDRDADVGD